jgi:hypothetical protein
MLEYGMRFVSLGWPLWNGFSLRWFARICAWTVPTSDKPLNEVENAAIAVDSGLDAGKRQLQ